MLGELDGISLGSNVGQTPKYDTDSLPSRNSSVSTSSPMIIVHEKEKENLVV